MILFAFAFSIAIGMVVGLGVKYRPYKKRQSTVRHKSWRQLRRGK